MNIDQTKLVYWKNHQNTPIDKIQINWIKKKMLNLYAFLSRLEAKFNIQSADWEEIIEMIGAIYIRILVASIDKASPVRMKKSACSRVRDTSRTVTQDCLALEYSLKWKQLSISTVTLCKSRMQTCNMCKAHTYNVRRTCPPKSLTYTLAISVFFFDELTPSTFEFTSIDARILVD